MVRIWLSARRPTPVLSSPPLLQGARVMAWRWWQTHMARLSRRGLCAGCARAHRRSSLHVLTSPPSSGGRSGALWCGSVTCSLLVRVVVGSLSAIASCARTSRQSSSLAHPPCLAQCTVPPIATELQSAPPQRTFPHPRPAPQSALRPPSRIPPTPPCPYQRNCTRRVYKENFT